MVTYRNRVVVRLQDTDAVGVIFFANQLVYAHETYERFMEQIGCGFADILAQGEYLLVIVHASADYRRPVRVGDIVDVEMSVARTGKSSFTLDYLLSTEDGTEIGRCSTVHVSVDRTNMKKMEIPKELRESLERYSSGR